MLEATQAAVRALATADGPASPAEKDPRLALDPTWEKLARKELRGHDINTLYWRTPEVRRPPLGSSRAREALIPATIQDGQRAVGRNGRASP